MGTTSDLVRTVASAFDLPEVTVGTHLVALRAAGLISQAGRGSSRRRKLYRKRVARGVVRPSQGVENGVASVSQGVVSYPYNPRACDSPFSAV